MEQQLRVGMVGTSWFAETVHMAGIRSHPRAELTAICGRDRARAAEVADRQGGPVVFTDYREMMNSRLLDAAVIVTPDDLHHEMALYALASGLHVLCEKPLARTGADAQEMLQAAEASGKVHMVMFTWRWMGVASHVRRLIEDGYLGRCRYAHLSMNMQADDPVYEWKFDPYRGSGMLGDLGSHLIDLARWFVGEITQVNGRLTTTVARPGPDGGPMASLNDSATMLVEFAGGAHGTLQVSGARVLPWGPQVEVRLYGENASLKADFDLTAGRVVGCRDGDEAWSELPTPEELLGTSGGNPFILDLPMMAPFTNLPAGDRLFVDAALNRRSAEPTFEDGWRAQQVVDAVIASNQHRCWMTVPKV